MADIAKYFASQSALHCRVDLGRVITFSLGKSGIHNLSLSDLGELLNDLMPLRGKALPNVARGLIPEALRRPVVPDVSALRPTCDRASTGLVGRLKACVDEGEQHHPVAPYA